MKKNLILLLMIISVQIMAQDYPITDIKVNIPKNPEGNIANWINLTNVFSIEASAKIGGKAIDKMVQLSKILVTINQGNKIICGTYTNLTAPKIEFNTETKVWTGKKAVSFIGGKCVLNPGKYYVSVQFFGSSKKPLSEEFKKPFAIREKMQQTYQSPELIAPKNGFVFSVADTEKPISFQWNGVSPKPEENLIYKIRIFKIMKGQTGIEAMKENGFIWEKDVMNETQVTGISASEFLKLNHQKFGWYVQATNQSGKTIGTNNGMSKIYDFIFETKQLNSNLEVIELILPEEKTYNPRPTFRWKPIKSYKDLTYTIKIIPILENQNEEDAIKKNKAFWEVANIKETFLQYPPEAAPMDSTQNYICSIQAIRQNGNVIASVSLLWFWGCHCNNLSPGPQPITICNSDPVFSIPPPGWISGVFCFQKEYAWFINGSLISLWGSTNSPLSLDPSSSSLLLYPNTNIITWKARGTNIFGGNALECNVEITVTVYPQLSLEIHELYPGVNGNLISEICETGAQVTLYVDLPPDYSDYEVSWSWIDNPPSGMSGTLVPSSNPINDVPIPNYTSSCQPGQSFFIREYTATITPKNTGTPPWPTGCDVLVDSLRVWCPSDAGTINVDPGDSICRINNNPISLDLYLTGNNSNNITWTRSPATTNPLPSNVSSISDVITQPGNYVYTATVQNGPPPPLGCPPSSTQITVHVEDLLVANISSIDPIVSTSPIKVCPNDAVKLQLNSQPTGTQIQWEYSIDCNGIWHPAGTSQIQNTNKIGDQGFYSPTPTSSLCWRAIVSSAMGICPSDTSAVFQINLFPSPSQPFISAPPGALPKCLDHPVVLTASVQAGTPQPVAYQWYLNGILLPGETNQQLIAITPGFYMVEIWVEGLCSSALSMPFEVTICEINPFIKGTCSSNGSTTIPLLAVPNPSPNNASSCNTSYTYLWSTGETTQGISVTPAVTTTYCVVITDGIGCTKEVCITIIVCQ